MECVFDLLVKRTINVVGGVWGRSGAAPPQNLTHIFDLNTERTEP